jgi:hypothetical protein
MTIGWAIFASTLLVLLVLNKPFRKFFLRASLVLAAVAVVVGGGWFVYDIHQQHVAEATQRAWKAQEEKLVNDCIARQARDGDAIDAAAVRATCTLNPDAEPVKIVPTPPIDYEALAKKFGGRPEPAVKPKPKPEPTNFEIRIHDGSYMENGQRQQAYVDYTCVNTTSGEIMADSIEVSPNWEVRNPHSLGYSVKKFADFSSADAYAKRTITADCKKWVAK